MESGQTPPEQPQQQPDVQQQPIFVAAGHQPPPGYVAYYPAHAGQPAPAKRSNGNATASLIVSGGALALLIFSAGILSPLTVIGSIVGTILGHKGRSAANEDASLGQRDEAVAGFWMGIAGIILAVLAIIAAIIVIAILIAADGDTSNWEFDHDGSTWQ